MSQNTSDLSSPSVQSNPDIFVNQPRTPLEIGSIAAMNYRGLPSADSPVLSPSGRWIPPLGYVNSPAGATQVHSALCRIAPSDNPFFGCKLWKANVSHLLDMGLGFSGYLGSS